MHRLSEIMLCVTVITGTGGLGKTYFALKLCQIIDPKFDINRQVVFDSQQFLSLINSGLKMGSCIVIDESQFGMSARDWGEREQKDFMKIFQTIRSLGYCVFIVALNEAIIDNIARGYCLTHKIKMKGRGVGQSMRYIIQDTKSDMTTQILDDEFYLTMPDSDICDAKSCLTCQYSGIRPQDWARKKQWDKLYSDGICGSLRAIYERLKKGYIEQQSQETIGKHATTPQVNPETLQLALLKIEDRLKLTMRNQYDLDVMNLELQKELKIPPLAARTMAGLRAWLETEHPAKLNAKRVEKQTRRTSQRGEPT
jgi:hypothetical protein